MHKLTAAVNTVDMWIRNSAES